MPNSRKKNEVKKGRWGRLGDWARAHKLDLGLISLLVVISGAVSAVNMTGYPQRFEDEGTYISQAWAVQEKGELAHYTYWYDHPPVGWIQMAGHLSVTQALERYGSAITAGREFMLLIHLATIVLLFALARRLGIGRVAAGVGTLLYALSPLVVEFSRYILLDNVALPWMLAAFFLALSPRRHLFTVIGSAVCMAIAVLSKETFIVLLPVLLYALWRNGDARNRRYLLTAFGVIFVMVSGLYVLYALLKNEFFPGEGHVSLLGTLFWQVFGREGSGSIFDPNSGSRGLIGYWLDIDFWLLAAGTLALPFAFLYRQLRMIGFALLVGLALLLRNGYLPYPYVVALLPFAALTVAGALHYAILLPLQNRSSALRWRVYALGVVVLTVGAAIFVAPTWYSKLFAITSVDQDASSRQAVAWIDANVSRDKRLVVESALWTDLEIKAFADPVWLYKTETDPEIANKIGGWQGIDYIVLNGPTVGARSFGHAFPTVAEAIKHAQVIAEFGRDNQKILVYRVNH